MVKRGEILLCDFGHPLGHEAGYRRPALVVSHDALNRHGILVVLPLTRSARGYPTHVEVEGVLPVISYVQCELVRSISTDRVVRAVGEIDAVDLARVEVILRRLLGLPMTSA